MTETAIEQNSSAGVRWDLSRLFDSPDAARAALEVVLRDCQSFRALYRGRVGELDGAAMAEALEAYGHIENQLGRIGYYAYLSMSTDVNGQVERDLNADVDRRLVEAANALRFLELEWIAADEAHASAVIDDPRVAANRHWLQVQRRFAPHTRTEPEEEMLAEREPAATGAWHTLFDQVTSTLPVPFEGSDRTIDEVLAFVRDEKRDRRRAAYDAVFSALEPHAPVLAHVYDTIVADRLVQDRVRSFGGPREARDLANELPAAAVDHMLAACERHHHLAHRWFRHKARLLRLDQLALWDQYAPVGDSRRFTYDEAAELVASSFGRFDPRIERIARSCYGEHRIDAEPRSGKRGGAFCASVAQDAEFYMLMNFTERLDDVRTLAHELGHGMHFELSGERQTPLTHHAPLALSEVPSTFAEMIVTDRLLAAEEDPDTRLAIYASSIESSFATVFRQTVMVRYEQASYGLRGEGKTLQADRLGEFWVEANRAYYGDVVELPDAYRFGWAYIPHFIHTRFYTYAYVFAHLVSLALTARYRADGDAFVGPYLDFLSMGYGTSPTEQLAVLGLDVTREDCWDAGFAEIERLIEKAEAEA